MYSIFREGEELTNMTARIPTSGKRGTTFSHTHPRALSYTCNPSLWVPLMW